MDIPNELPVVVIDSTLYIAQHVAVRLCGLEYPVSMAETKFGLVVSYLGGVSIPSLLHDNDYAAVFSDFRCDFLNYAANGQLYHYSCNRTKYGMPECVKRKIAFGKGAFSAFHDDLSVAERALLAWKLHKGDSYNTLETIKKLLCINVPYTAFNLDALRIRFQDNGCEAFGYDYLGHYRHSLAHEYPLQCELAQHDKKLLLPKD